MMMDRHRLCCARGGLMCHLLLETGLGQASGHASSVVAGGGAAVAAVAVGSNP